MALLLVNDGDAVKKLTGIAPADMDYTCLFYWKFTGTADDKILFVILDATGTYDDWVYITLAPTSFIGLTVGHNGGEEQTSTIEIDTDTWYAIAYTRLGSLHSFYINGNLIGTVTEDISDATFGETWLGDDSFGNGANQTFFDFREFTRALTPAELLAEFISINAASTLNLWSDVTFLIDINDESGNGYDFTLVNANSFVGQPPTNITVMAAVDLGSLPVDLTYNANNSDDTETFNLFFKITVPTTINELGIWAFGGSVGTGYQPAIQVLDSDQAFILAGETNKPLQVPVDPLSTYYLYIIPNGTFNPAILTLSVLAGPTTNPPIGSIVIPDDGGGILPLVIISGVTGEVLKFIHPFPSGEAGDTLRNGISLVEDLDAGDLKLYDSSFNLINNVIFSWVSTNPFIRSNLTSGQFYVADGGSGGTNATVTTVSDAGFLSVTTWDLGAPGLKAIASNRADTFLYYSLNPNITRVDLWNLITDTDAGIFAAAVSSHPVFDIIVMSNNVVVVGYFKSTVTRSLLIKIYDQAGGILQEIDLGSNYRSSPSPHINVALDDPNSFWVWTHLESPTGMSRFFNIKISDGTTIATFDTVEFEGGIYQADETDDPLARFGNAFSCPFFILQSTVFPPAQNLSGIYQMVPGKTNDTVFTNVDANITEVRKIPDPFFRI